MDALRRTALYVACALLISHCWSLAEFEQFPGFDAAIATVKSSNAPAQTVTTTTPRVITTMIWKIKEKPKIDNKNGITTKNPTSEIPSITTTGESNPLNATSHKPFVCPEEEKPSNIGPYEVPTQKDLVIHIRATLKTKFNSYHRKAMFFLNDIKQATRATAAIESKCSSKSKAVYRQCVKHVDKQCQTITKGMVTSMERQRHDVEGITEATLCNLSAMKTDPVQLIKILAMEDASLDFALSGFLRLLSACSRYCQKDHTQYRIKPIRHMTDQDLVIRHFLTHKNYAVVTRK